MNITRIHLVGIVALMPLCVSLDALAANQSDTAMSRAIESYFDGKVTTAIAELEAALPAPDALSRQEEIPAELDALINICAWIRDPDCIDRWAGPATDIMLAKARRLQGLQQTMAAQKGEYFLALWDWTGGDRESAEQALDDLGEDVDAPLDPVLYVDRQLLAASLHLSLDQREQARIATERALATLLAISNPNENRWFVSTRLVICLALTAASGDIERVYGHYLLAGDHLARSFPPKSFDMLVFRVFESEFLQRVRDTKGALGAGLQARELLDSMQLPLNVRAQLEVGIDQQVAINAVLANELDKGGPALARLNSYVGIRPTRASIEKLDGQLVSALAINVVFMVASRAPVDPTIKQLLELPLDNDIKEPLRTQLEIFQRYARLLASGELLSPNAKEQARELAKQYLQWTNQRGKLSFELFPRPSAIDRMIAWALMTAMSNTPTENRGDVELLLQLSDLATRSSVSVGGEIVAMAGLTSNEAERQALHQGLRISSRRSGAERDELRRIVSLTSASDEPKDYLQIDYLRRTVLADFFGSVEKTAAFLGQQNPAVNSSLQLPKLAELQGALKDDEAVVKIVPYQENELLTICVTSTSALARRTPIDVRQSDADARIIQLALTRAGAPDKELDKQFPAEASTRLYAAIFGGAENCINDKSVVYWAVGRDMISIPPSAFLTRLPPRVPGGFDLKRADWLVKSKAISMLESPGVLIASRKKGNEGSVTSRKLLGIGDPTLAGLTSDGVTRSSVVLRGSRGARGGALTSLPQLPDTKEELIVTERAVGEPSTVLVGDEATEGNFRRQQISDFEYLSFATHGLVREEVEGLQEAALVLTPVKATDQFDDGLLTASEIADLSLNAKFVALSACNTANIDLVEFSADVPGLATAFAIAGAPATLATLWPVDSMTSKHIVAGLFGQLARDRDERPASALAAAQREYIQSSLPAEYAHPRFWAPFLVFGSNSGGESERGDEPLALAATSVRAEFDRGGEILSIASTPRAGLLATGIGKWDGDKLASVTAAYDAAGNALWIDENRELAGGSIVAIGDHSIAFYYINDGRDLTRSAVRLELRDKSGKVIRSAVESSKGNALFPVEAIAMSDGTVAAAFLALGSSTGTAASERRIVISRYAADLKQLRTSEWKIADGFMSVNVSLVETRSSLLVAVSDRLPSYTKTAYQDSLQNLRPCSTIAGSEYYELDKTELSLRRQSSIEKAEARSVFARQGVGAFITGATIQCDGSTHLAVWAVEEAGVRLIFEDDSPLATRGIGGQVLGDGTLAIVGTSTRATDVPRQQERQESLDAKSSSPDKLSFSVRSTSDLLVMIYSPTKAWVRRRVISFGGDVFVGGGIDVGKSFIAFGAVGGTGALFEVRVPSDEVLSH